MKKYVPIEKMSKKMQREYYKKQRKDWGGISPVTRRSENPKAYDRAKAKKDHENFRDPFLFFYAALSMEFKVCISSYMESANIAYPLRGSFTKTWVTAPTILPFWIMGLPLIP